MFSPLVFVAFALSCVIGCRTSVHPRIGDGLPPPAWVEVDKPLAPEEEREASGDGRAESGPREISARHILAMYKGSAHAPLTVGRTKEEAHARLLVALGRLRAGESWEKLVEEFTDEPGGAARGGDLGKFDRSRMVEAFSKAAFSLKPGEVSEIIETPFGFHIIQRTE